MKVRINIDQSLDEEIFVQAKRMTPLLSELLSDVEKKFNVYQLNGKIEDNI